MTEPARHPAQPEPQVETLLALFDGLDAETQAAFALRRCVAMSHAIQKVYGPLTDVRAKPLKIVFGGPYQQMICTLDGRRISNGDVLELLLGVPERWLAVWIDGLPERLDACLLTPYEVSRIELHERSFLRWPLDEHRALKRLAARLREEAEEKRRARS